MKIQLRDSLAQRLSWTGASGGNKTYPATSPGLCEINSPNQMNSGKEKEDVYVFTSHQPNQRQLYEMDNK